MCKINVLGMREASEEKGRIGDKERLVKRERKGWVDCRLRR